MTALRSLFYRLRRLSWRVFRPTTLGSRCLVLRGESVLLVRHTYQRKYWYLPGGGVEKSEAFVAAARREVWEETGLRVEDLRLFHLYFSQREGKNDHVALFVAESVAGEPRAIGPEIAEAAFFSLNALPSDTSPATRRRIAEYLGAARADEW